MVKGGNLMNGLAEISATWRWWNHCVEAAKMFPKSELLQAHAARAPDAVGMYSSVILGGGSK